MVLTATIEKTHQQQNVNFENTFPTEPSWEKVMPMITFNLLNPRHSLPVQTWHLEANSTIKIGRSSKNEVTLYSTVVSRYHLKIEQNGENWELVNFGSNGTFCNGKRITRTPLKNGMVIRLGNSGPQLQIWLDCLTEERNESVTKLLR